MIRRQAPMGAFHTFIAGTSRIALRPAALLAG